MRRTTGVVVAMLVVATATALLLGVGSAPGRSGAQSLVRPMLDGVAYLGNSGQPPSQAACNAVRRRCFNPASMASSYNYAGLHAAGNLGQGRTIAVVDSFGATTVRQDLGVFNTAFGLPHLCGETGPSDPSANCPSSVSPRFDIVCVQGCPTPKPPPSSNGTGQENKNLWDLEVALDVEWAHATAPLANIMLVTTPTAQTLGVQGLPDMMNAIQFMVDNHLADVISMSFGTGEGAFNGGLAALVGLRTAFVNAATNHITLFASSGDSGTANIMKTPVKNPQLIPYPSVGWPASDPLVTAVGGTYLCTDANTGLTIDNVSPPTQCRAHPGQRENGWIPSGGGYSILFPRPDYQNTLPPGSTFVGSSVGAPGPNVNMRGIPDIAYQASARTGVLVYMSEPATTTSGTGCGGANPCSIGWYVVGGTSSSSPQWAGLTAIADQMAGRDLGQINPALYTIASNSVSYATDFHDITTNCNQIDPSIPGYCASQAGTRSLDSARPM